MTGSPRAYRYVGPPDLLARADPATPGRAVRTQAELADWLAGLTPAERADPVTYVVDRTGVLRPAPRRSEHVACAGGQDVRTAGEIRFSRRDDGGWAVHEISNLSTGYCPDPDSWPAAASALSRAGIPGPDGFTWSFVFRRCPVCAQTNLVKDEDLACAVCGAALPVEWNFDTPHPAATAADRPLPPAREPAGPAAGRATSAAC